MGSHSLDDDFSHLVGAWDVVEKLLKIGWVGDLSSESHGELFVHKKVAWVESTWSVLLAFLDDLHVVCLFAALLEVEEQRCVKHALVVELGLEVDGELVAVHEQVVANAHAVNDLLTKFF